jgi:hypothetical protein
MRASVEEFSFYDLDDQCSVAACRMQLLSCTNSSRARDARGETREFDSGIGEGMLARCGGQLLIFLGEVGVEVKLAFWWISVARFEFTLQLGQPDINARRNDSLSRAPIEK